MEKMSRARAEINLDALANNLKRIKKQAVSGSKVCCVIKADGYGHGVEGIVPTLEENGADALAVACLDEAIQLRRMGVTLPVIVLGHTFNQRLPDAVRWDIIQTVSDYESARQLSAAAGLLKKEGKLDIKIDTGMSRLGIVSGDKDGKDRTDRTDYESYERATEIIKSICSLPDIKCEGIHTHFAQADSEDSQFTIMQFERFMNLLEELEGAGLSLGTKHACNSAALIKYPQMHLDMVRPGILLYGISPDPDINIKAMGFEPVMSVKSEIAMVKNIRRGDYVSYGRDYCASEDMRIAVISLGYADGFLRSLSNKGEVLINGVKCPIIGRVCMDLCVADISRCQEKVFPGDLAVIVGKDEKTGEEITFDDLASSAGTIAYEMVSLVGKRIPRVYLKSNVEAGVRNILVD